MSDLTSTLMGAPLPGAASKPVDTDPLREMIRAQRDAAISRRIHDANAEKDARVSQLARELDYPESIVATDLPGFEARARSYRAQGVISQYPAIGAWSANGNNAALAADDYSVLGLFGKAFESVRSSIANTGRAVGAGFVQNVLGGVYGQIGGIAENLAEISPETNAIFRPIADYSLGIQRADKARAARIRPQVDSWLAKNLLQGVESTPLTLAAIGVGAATRDPRTAAAMMASAVSGNEYVNARDAGLSPQRSLLYGAMQGSVEYITEKLPASRLISDLAKRTPIGKTFVHQLTSEIPQELAATTLQNINEWAALNPNKSIADFAREQPMAWLETAVATAGGVGTTVGISKAAERTVRVTSQIAERRQQASRAEAGAAFLDEIAAAAGQSKTAQRSPEALADLIQQLGEDSGVEEVFVPGEAVQSYMQSDQYVGDLDEWRSQIDEALVTGGDLVLPVGELTRLSTSPGWETLKADIRLSPGGMSMREAEAFNEAWADALDELSDQVAQEAEQERFAAAPREALLRSLNEKLSAAGMSASMARQNAEFLAQRAATRAARMGRELAGDEYDNLEVRLVLPESIAAVQKADQLDVAIDVMKRKKDPAQSLGPSLMEFISRGGGIVDTGGDLKSMGADQWHRSKPGTRKFVREQGELLDDGGFGENEYGLDSWAQRSWEAGYFPEFGEERPTANDLLDAIAEGVAGRDRMLVSRDKSIRDAAEELRALLENRGIDPDAASRAEIRKAVEAYAAEQADGEAYMQGEDAPRGRILFPGGQSATAIIELFQTQNQSTFLHEAGHLWLEELREDAADPDAPQQVRDDWAIVEGWFAQNGHPIVDGKIPVDAHELWATGVEKYLMEGRAPSPGLQRLFQTFKAWMVSLYNSVSRLRSPISDEVRGVMDRLVASDEELANAIAAQHIEALFPEKPAGMTAAEYASYQALTEAFRQDAQDRMLSKTMNAVKRRVSKEWREREEDVREDVAARVDALPEFRALKLLRVSPMDSGWVRDHLGEDAPAMLPRQVPPVHKENGANPDEIAELAGFASGDELIRALMGVEIRRREMREAGDKRSVRAAMIDQEVEQIMLERFGDPFTDGSIEEEALAAVQSDKLGEVMGAELRVLGRMTGERVTPYSVAKAWAERQVMEGRVRDVASRSAVIRYERAAAKAGKAAMDAVIANDHEEAFRQKQSQMLNNALIAAARRGADNVDEIVSRLDKWAKRRTVASVDQDYLERAQLLLEQVELKQRTQRSLERQESFEQWAAAREAEGAVVVVPPSFAASLGKTHWSRLKVSQLTALNDAVMQIINLGRHKQSLLDAKEEREFQAFLDEAVALAEQTPGRRLSRDRNEARRPVAEFLAGGLKMEVVAAELDNDQRNGPFTRLLIDRATEAENRREDLRDKVLRPIAALYLSMPKAQKDRLAQKITVPELVHRGDDNDPRNGLPTTLTRMELLAVALNTGNESNYDKLVRGEGWSRNAIETVLNRELMKEDWDFAQQIWDSLDSLWPDIAAVEKVMSGVEPERVEVRPIETRHGTYRGGYYPAVYDAARSQKAEDNSVNEANDLFGNRSGVATSKGHTIERTGYAAPLRLSVEDVLLQHVERVITRISYAEWARDVMRVIKNPKVRTVFDRKLGPEIRAQVVPWMQRQVNAGAVDRRGNAGIERFLRAARVNMTVVSMGLRWSTGIAQSVGLANSAGRIGVNNLRLGFQRLLRHRGDAVQFVFDRSPEMERRNEAMNRDVAEAFKQMRQKGGAMAKAQAFAFWHIGMIDRYMVAIPTWLGAHEKGLREGLTDVEASAYADKAVRLSQGSGREKDLSAWQSPNSEGLKFFTMFYTPFNVLMNAQWEVIRAGRRGDWRKAVALSFWFMIATPLLDAFVSGDLPDDDEEDVEGWSKWLARNVFFYLFAGVPIARDAATFAERKMAGKYVTFNQGPINRTWDATVKAGEDAWNATLGEDDASDRWVQHAIETPGYFLGLPTGQVSQTGQFIWDVQQGNQNPETFNDWYWGLTKGKMEE